MDDQKWLALVCNIHYCVHIQSKYLFSEFVCWTITTGIIRAKDQCNIVLFLRIICFMFKFQQIRVLKSAEDKLKQVIKSVSGYFSF